MRIACGLLQLKNLRASSRRIGITVKTPSTSAPEGIGGVIGVFESYPVSVQISALHHPVIAASIVLAGVDQSEEKLFRFTIVFRT